MHETFGGLFPNAPPLSTGYRHRLGKLALGDKCLAQDFFTPLCEGQQSSKEPDVVSCTAQASKGQHSAEASGMPEAPQPSTSALASPAVQGSHQVQIAQAREQVYQRLELSLRRLHALNEDSATYLEILQSLGDELDRVPNGNDATGLVLSLKATAAGRRRRGCQIRV